MKNNTSDGTQDIRLRKLLGLFMKDKVELGFTHDNRVVTGRITKIEKDYVKFHEEYKSLQVNHTIEWVIPWATLIVGKVILKRRVM